MIKLKNRMANPVLGNHPAGAAVTFDDATEKQLVESGQAEWYELPPSDEEEEEEDEGNDDAQPEDDPAAPATVPTTTERHIPPAPGTGKDVFTPPVPSGAPEVGTRLEDAGIAPKDVEHLRAGGVRTVEDVKAHADLTSISGIGSVGAKRIGKAIAKFERSRK